MANYRCIQCAKYHEGDCDARDKLAWRIDCLLDDLDACAGLPPEPGSRRWLVKRGEYPPLTPP